VKESSLPQCAKRTTARRKRAEDEGEGRRASPAAEGEGSAFSLLMETGPRPIEQMCVPTQLRNGRDWLGREDSNLENPPERCGMEFPDPERTGVTYLLLANCATGTPVE
jgi:hypothetical protein